MRQITLCIKNMTCPACEQTIVRALKRVKGIHDAQADYKRGTVSFAYDGTEAVLQNAKTAILDSGYCLINGKSLKEHSEVLLFLGILAVAVLVYIFVERTIGFDFLPEISPQAGYGALFVAGLITSLHCVAMCGGINLSQSASQKSNQVVKPSIAPALFYNAGRMISYTAVGGIVGAVGSLVGFTGKLKGIVAIVAGIFVLVMGLNMFGIKLFRRLWLRLPAGLTRKLYGGKSKKTPFVIGLLNGFMPCGPLQAMQLVALATGSFLSGALSMLFFSAGTVPLMLGFGIVGAFLNARFKKIIAKVSAALVLFFGVSMLLNGFALSGISLAAPAATQEADLPQQTPQQTSRSEASVQKVSSTFTARGYTPITVKAGVPVVWTITVQKGGLTGCNNRILIPEYGIEKQLIEGENIVEFTPQDEGVFAYSCWMGMIRSSITVTGADSTVSPTASPVLFEENAEGTVTSSPESILKFPSCCG